MIAMQCESWQGALDKVREALVMHVGNTSPSNGRELRLVRAAALTFCPDRSAWKFPGGPLFC